jgi:hypothetical protein
VLPFGCRCPSVSRILRVADIRDCWEEAAYDHALARLPLDERSYPADRQSDAEHLARRKRVVL